MAYSIERRSSFLNENSGKDIHHDFRPVITCDEKLGD